MTVAELIEKLRQFDQNLKVVTNGFDEYGYNEVAQVELKDVAPTVGWSISPYNDPGQSDAAPEAFQALWINF